MKTRKVDLELEELVRIRQQLKPVKTIKTQINDVYDCIDVQRQPAVYLTNHTIQMNPTSLPEEGSTTNSLGNKHSCSTLVTTDCPKGTVPIRRFSNEDLQRIHKFSKSYAANVHPQTSDQPGKHFAIVKYQVGKSFGSIATFSAHNLTVRNDQWSASQMWIENNRYNQINSVQAGWTVAPPLNGDGVTRLFAYWEGQGGACFNHLCDAFVQVDNQIPVDVALYPVSVYGGTQMDLKLSIFKDNTTGNWWLQLFHGRNGSEATKIGYWKKERVPQLEQGASYLAWGGLATFSRQGPAPPLGNGHPFDYNEDYTRHSYFCQISMYDELLRPFIPSSRYAIQPYVSNDKCYGVNYLWIQKALGLTFLFGGQGGNCGP